MGKGNSTVGSRYQHENLAAYLDCGRLAVGWGPVWLNILIIAVINIVLLCSDLGVGRRRCCCRVFCGGIWLHIAGRFPLGLCPSCLARLRVLGRWSHGGLDRVSDLEGRAICNNAVRAGV